MTGTIRGPGLGARAALLIMYYALLPAAPAHGHAFAPSLLEIRETSPGHAVVRWKQPAVRIAGSGLVPIMSESCRRHGESKTSVEVTGVVASWEIDCAGGLVAQTILVEGIAESQANVLLRLVLADGRSVRHVLTADEPSFVVPEQEGTLDVIVGYGRLGVEHILTGFDHLLFVLGLVLLVRGGRRLLWTVTAFTLGHSMTLALAVLGFVHLPQQPMRRGSPSAFTCSQSIWRRTSPESRRSWNGPRGCGGTLWLVARPRLCRSTRTGWAPAGGYPVGALLLQHRD